MLVWVVMRPFFLSVGEKQSLCPPGAGCLFPREPVNFVHRKWTISQEISQNISEVLTNLTFLVHFVYENSSKPWNISKFNVFDTFSVAKGAKLLQNTTRNLVDIVAVHRKARKKRRPGTYDQGHTLV